MKHSRITRAACLILAALVTTTLLQAMDRVAAQQHADALLAHRSAGGSQQLAASPVCPSQS